MTLNLEINEGNPYIYEYPIGIRDGDPTNGQPHPYRAVLEFQPIKVDGQTISKFAGTDLGIFNLGKKTFDFAANFIGATNKDKSSSDIGFGEEVRNFKDKGTLADLKTIEPVELNDNFGKKLPQHAYLYMPMTVQQMENVAVGPESLGVVGGTIASVIKGGDATLTGITGAGVRGAVGGIMDFVSGNASKELGSLVANKIASRLNTQAGIGVQSATRLQISPNTRSIFKQVNIREWNFSFQLIPTSEKESIEIENIIDFFRSEQLPEELGTGQISMAYRFPNLIQIRALYMMDDGDMKNIITRFLPAYLQSVDVTYNTSGMSFYDNGKFHDATLNIKFIEYRPLNKRDISVERKYLGRGKVGNNTPGDFS
tara:strand:- start:57 stop:1166 length:1110 start_codon:yes stop_codon:yes gene_type:complete